MQDEEFYDACRNGRLEDARAFQREADPNWKDFWVSLAQCVFVQSIVKTPRLCFGV